MRWLHRQLGVVSHHGVGLVAGLVVLVDHSVLLGSGSSLVISLGMGTRLPQIIPRGGATSNIVGQMMEYLDLFSF